MARLLLALLLSRADRSTILADLAEEYRSHILPERGRRGARRWYWRQVLGSVGPILARRAERLRSRLRRDRTRSSEPFPDGESFMNGIVQDVGYAMRVLRRRPGTTLIAVLVLALAIGAVTALFSVLDGVVLRPLPYEDPDRLMIVWETRPDRGVDKNPVSPANFVDWRDRADSFEDLAAFTTGSPTLTGIGEPTRLSAARVSPSLTRILEVEAAIGRDFAREEAEPGNDDVVLLGHSLWEERFGADPDAVGQTVELDGRSHTVVGVMPRGFDFPRNPDVWLPLAFDFDVSQSRGAHYLIVVGRLKPGTSRQGAQAEMDAIAAALREAHPDKNADAGVRVMSLHEEVVGDVRPVLLLLLAAMGGVLLIACANVANLELARAAGRSRELAVRAALGAGRGRLFRQLLIESLMMGLVAGVAGLVVATFGIRVFVFMAPDGVPRVDRISMGTDIFLFTTAVSVLAALAFGTLPAWRFCRPELHGALEAGAGHRSVAGDDGRLRSGLVVAEVALALLLVVGAGLMLRSFAEITGVDPGFDPEPLLLAPIELPDARYPDDRNRIDFFETLLERVEALPGARSAAAVSWAPLEYGWSFTFEIVGRPQPEAGQSPQGNFRPVTPGYFRTLGIPIVRGRALGATDRADAAPVIVVNEALVDRYFPDEDPLGQRLVLGYGPPGSEQPEREIVGIVGNVRQYGLGAGAPPTYYLPYAQLPFDRMTLAVRTGEDPLELAPSIRSAVWSLDDRLAVDGFETMEARLEKSVSPRRFTMTLLGVFAALGLVLAALGIYGILSYSVSRRTREIGVRMALGAGTSQVLRMVVLRGMGLTGIGLALGLAGAVALSRLLSGMLYGVTPTDPLTYGSVVLLLAAVAALACWIPARRATRVDPLTAMRNE